MNHPAKTLGEWITAKRRSAGVRVSEAAGLLGLGPIKYTEMECGIGKWLTVKHVGLLSSTLRLSTRDKTHLATLQRRAVDDPEITRFSDVFTRDMLAPIRYRTYQKSHTVSAKEEITILDHVFTETVA